MSQENSGRSPNPRKAISGSAVRTVPAHRLLSCRAASSIRLCSSGVWVTPRSTIVAPSYETSRVGMKNRGIVAMPALTFAAAARISERLRDSSVDAVFALAQLLGDRSERSRPIDCLPLSKTASYPEGRPIAVRRSRGENRTARCRSFRRASAPCPGRRRPA